MPCVNLGCAHAGLDAFLSAPDVLALAGDARVCVIQLMGAQNLSNAYYRVHPRRNDRFLAASPRLRAMYRSVDFTAFHFNGHLLQTLSGAADGCFEHVRTELQQTWLVRMAELIAVMRGRVVLLWAPIELPAGASGAEPMFVTRQMVEALRPLIRAIVEVPLRGALATGDLDEMEFAPMQAPAAAHLPGPTAHIDMAKALVPALEPLLE